MDQEENFKLSIKESMQNSVVTLDDLNAFAERAYQAFLKKERENGDRIFVQLYDTDAFNGISLPRSFETAIHYIIKNTDEVIDGNIVYNRAEFNEWEVECAHQARDGSKGIQHIESFDKFIEEISWFGIDEEVLQKARELV